MAHEIITALIGIVPALLVSIVSIVNNNQVIKVKLESIEKALNIKIDELDKKVEKHNKVIERTYKLESDVGASFKRIDDLRSDVESLKK